MWFASRESLEVCLYTLHAITVQSIKQAGIMQDYSFDLFPFSNPFHHAYPLRDTARYSPSPPGAPTVTHTNFALAPPCCGRS